jgi:Yip1 domain
VQSNFLSYYLSAFYRPSEVFQNLQADKNKTRYAFYAVLIQAFVYTLVYIFLILGDGKPFKPWLKIPDEVYYRYNVFFLAPSMLLGWILAAGVMHLLSSWCKGFGSFEDTLCITGFGIGIASWATGVHDLITSFLGGIHVINQNAYELLLNTATVWRAILWVLMIAYGVWFCVLFSKGIKVMHSSKRSCSIVIGIIGFIIYQLFFFIFNR